ncbi:MAG: hypothetical protein V3T24_08635 [Longimicrobiales bacterium]
MSVLGTEVARRGILLPAMLLLIVAITLIAHGALILAEAELEVSTVARAVLTARLSAEAGVVTAMAGPTAWPVDAAPWRAEPVREGPFGPHGSFSVTATLVEPELTLWEGVGARTGYPLAYRVGRIAWRLSPGSRLASAGGVVESGHDLSTSAGSIVDGTRMSEPPAGWAQEACAPFAETLAWAVPSGRLPRRSTLPVDPPGVPPLGLLGGFELAARALRIPPGSVTPLPRERDGACLTDVSTNWGSPSGSGVCRDHFVLIHASGDLTLEGGEGQGVLVVDGSLRLESGSSFLGVVLATGDVQLAEGALVQGLVRARGSVAVTGLSQIVGSGCAVLAALSGVEALLRLFVVPEGSWVGPLGSGG